MCRVNSIPVRVPQPADQLVHGLVPQRPPVGFGEQVHEHVVSRTNPGEIGIVCSSTVFARAPFTLSRRGTIRSSRRWDTKSACRNPNACPIRIAVSAIKSSRKRSRRCSHASTRASSSSVRVRGSRRDSRSRSRSGRVATGRPAVTWCRNGR